MAILSIGAVALAVFAAVLGLGIVAGVLWLLWRLLRIVFQLLGRVLGLLRRQLVDAIHAAGALLTAGATLPLMAGNFAIFRPSAARHYGRAFLDELKGVGVGAWRVALGNPLRFLGLGALVDGVERRLPDVMERAPRARRARRATFDGYEVVGTLPSGGSGAQLFVARPRPATHQRFQRAGRSLPSEVVIKSFALETGSTLPQIVRESRALEAASRMGLVCEHQLTDDHFYYVMPYVKGEDLDRVTRALHARGNGDGLADAELHLALTYSIDLLDALQRFHSGGLWHKDVKPSNILVAKGRAHLVDFGLVTPLASAMTLTTHGTEYYRDPELVRLAMQGVKVHEVDGVRFDVYSAGAVLYTLLENSFPAHGSLSRLTKRAPEALRWIVQRAMGELRSRYASAADMRADLAALAAAADPFALRPADLPSFRNAGEAVPVPSPVFDLPATRAALRSVASPSPAPFPAPAPTRRSRRRRHVLAAGVSGVAAASFLGALTVAFSHHPRHLERVAFATPVASLPEHSWSSLSARERKLLRLAEGVAEDLGGDEPREPAAPSAGSSVPMLVPGIGESPEDPASSVPTAAEPTSAETAPSDGPMIPGLPARGRVLVLDDLTSSVDGRVLALLCARLSQRGFAVVGREAGEDAAAEAIEILASARNALGLGRAEEPETQARLQRFLDDSGALDAVILVSRTPEETETLYRVLVRGPALVQAGGGDAGTED